MTCGKVSRRANNVRLIALDVDGVLTDGHIYLSSDGTEIKAFDAKDGFAIIMARKAGIQVVFISGRMTPAVELRAKHLGVTEVHEAFHNKEQVLDRILQHYHLSWGQAAYMGDDLFDLPAMKRVGLSAAPSDAHPDVLKEALWVAPHPGGRGAVRELVGMILDRQGLWETAQSSFLKEGL